MNRLKIKFGKKEIIAILLCFCFLFTPLIIKTADASFIGLNFSITLKDIQRYAKEVWSLAKNTFFVRLKNRMLTQIQNDIINSIQNGGKPRFMQNPEKFLTGAVDNATVLTLQKIFDKRGVDICSPFRLNVELLVSEVAERRDISARCTLGDIADNLENFTSDFTSGGWGAWIQLHETNNTPQGAFFGALQTLGADITTAQNAATLEVTAGSGFLDQTKCKEFTVKAYKFKENPDFGNLAGTRLDTLSLLNAIRIAPDAGDEGPYFNIIVPANENQSPIMKAATSKPSEEPGISSHHFSEVFEEIPGERIPIDVPDNIKLGIGNVKSSNSLWDAKCTDEETTTPGQTLANLTSGVLEKTGFDVLINADEIAEILNAVVDAYVNKALKYGVSKMPTKKGSWTTPQPQQSEGGNKVSIQTQLQGLEGQDGIELLRKVSALNTNSQSLIQLIKKLYAKEANLEKFSRRLDIIGGFCKEGDISNCYDNDGNIDTDKYFPGLDFSYLAGKGDGTNELADRAFDLVYSQKIYTFGNKDGNNYPDKISFNTESNNPGIYLANQTLYEHLSEKWHELSIAFRNLSTELRNLEGKGTKMCDDIRILETPEWNTENNFGYLPFTDGEGNLKAWIPDGKGDYRTHYYTDLIGYFNTVKTSPEEMEYYINQAKIIADTMATQNRQMAKGYTGLIEGARSMEAQIKENTNFATNIMPKISLYATILNDYDTAGSSDFVKEKMRTLKDLDGKTLEAANLTTYIKNYTEALDNKGKINIENAYRNLRYAQMYTRNAWIQTQNNIISSDTSTSEEKAHATEKLPYINSAVLLIDDSLKEILLLADNKTAADFTQIGISASEAVAQALGLDKDSTISEIESREGNITKLKNEIQNEIGKFISDEAERRRISYEGGDNEWEQYFRNRLDFVNVKLFLDFYGTDDPIYSVSKNCKTSEERKAAENEARAAATAAEASADEARTAEEAGAASTLPAIIKVMPLGDSNTSGYGSGETANSYRQKLSGSLAADTTINYAGGGYYPGWSIGNIQALVDNNSILNANPDIALLMIGTNDMYTYVPPTSTNSNDRYPIYESGVTQKLEKLRQLLISMHAKNPSMNIIVAKISSPTGGNAQISAPNLPQADVTRMFHDGIDGIVSGIGGTGSGKIRTVDMWECGTIPSMSDGLHYNATGYQCLANKWEAGIKALYSE